MEGILCHVQLILKRFKINWKKSHLTAMMWLVLTQFALSVQIVICLRMD